jgi:uncharacterized protein YdhG (YjbR/CyaY superfamily)
MAIKEANKRPRWRMPSDVKATLDVNGLKAAYDERPPYQRNDYLGWIIKAKREETREKRISRMIEELRDGVLYMGMAWKKENAKARSPKKNGAAEVDAYIEAFPEDVRRALNEMRAIIKAAATGAEERISYGMPSFHQGGPVAYYGAAKAHIGFYPTPSGIGVSEAELDAYPHSKGTIRFPLGEKLPAALIKRIVKFRLAEVKAKAGSDRSRRRA